jgi:DNA-binding response OmpR family regulator
MNRGRPKLLIIDDDPRVVQVWTLTLEDAGFEIVTALSGKEGLRMAYNEHPDLILLDIMMPGMDGFQVLDHLRLLTDVPVIMLTAVATDANKIRGLDKGVADFVPKVTHAEVLIAHIRNRLRSYNGNNKKDGRRRLDNFLEVDFPRRQLHYNGEQVNLTPLQWRLLQSLVEHEGRVTTYRDLLNAGWENPEFHDSRSVKVQISLLREKLHDQANPSHYIHTIREEGYLFEVRSQKL